MTFSDSERATLAGLADTLIPAGEGFPPASGAGVAGAGLDQLMLVRPDLETGLRRILQAAHGRPSAEVVKELQERDKEGFGVLAEVVPGAYFMNPAVRAALGYTGQSARPIDPRPDHLDDGLLQSVQSRGPIYRATPGKENAKR
jgi:hypothetical protein